MAVKICSGSYLGQKVISAGNSGFIYAVYVQEKHLEVSDAFRTFFCTKIGHQYVAYVDLTHCEHVNVAEDVMKYRNQNKKTSSRMAQTSSGELVERFKGIESVFHGG